MGDWNDRIKGSRGTIAAVGRVYRTFRVQDRAYLGGEEHLGKLARSTPGVVEASVRYVQVASAPEDRVLDKRAEIKTQIAAAGGWKGILTVIKPVGEDTQRLFCWNTVVDVCYESQI